MKMKRRSLIKILKTGILIFGISLLLWNCKQDQNEFLDTLSIEQVIPNYSQKIVSLTKVPEVEKYLNDKLPKNSFQRTNEETGITMNYDAVLELVDSLENLSYSIRFTFDDSPEGEFFNLVVGKTIEGEFTQPRVLGYVCDEEQVEIFVAHHYDMNYFKGTVSLYNYVTFFSHAERTKRSRTTTGSINIEPCDQQTYTGGGGDPYDSNNPDDWNPIDPEGTGGGSGLGDIDTSSGSGGSCTWSWGTTGPCDEGGHGVHSPSSCGAGTGVSPVLNINCGGVRTVDELGCGDPIPIGVNSEEDVSVAIMKKIESSELDPCSNDILTDLKSLQENNIANIISRFGNPDSAYDWEIKNGTPTNLNNSAETNWAEDSNGNAITNSYLTIIDNSYVNQATNLAIARTLLHEAIHAYIISYIDDLAGGNTQGFSTEFPDLWNNFISQKYGVPADNIENYHHQEMAENFVDINGDALAEYDNNQADDIYYKYLAWGALMNTDAFSSALEPGGYMTQSEQEAILIANNQEDTNGSEAKGSPCP